MQPSSVKLLEWYAEFGRDLPWRQKGGVHDSPYKVLVSEFMLQQTTVKTVIPYFSNFMRRFPTVSDLAQASIDEVYRYWQGLGYYTRARSLHATAKIICEQFGGCFPTSRNEVLKLKGIGEYTASSFLALAFNQPETVIDGNVIRIISRLFHLTDPVDSIKSQIAELASMMTDRKNPADYASAIMDLGALVCTPKNPQCLICPWHYACSSAKIGDQTTLPKHNRPPKKEKFGFVYLIYNSAGQIFVRKRLEKGLLSGLYEFPWSEENILKAAKNTNKSISHTFTHFKLNLQILILQSDSPDFDGNFINTENLKDYPISTLMKKVFAEALKLF